MLEQIHETPEDQRKTLLIVALGLLGFAVYALAAAAVSGGAGLGMLGVCAALYGGGMARLALGHPHDREMVHA